MQRAFSRKWVILSLLVFLGLEVLLGGLVGRIVLGGFVSGPFRFRLELALMLGSYFLGGLIVGFASRSVRLLEPAVGAFVAVALTFVYSLFTPVRFFGFAPNRIVFGGLIAFGLALAGADLGERLAARLGNRASQRYAGG